ncbi:MAG: efflux RND transporter periplasmic adaptor subunit [Elusimicrobiales bacterium]|nr:efflux RND transporter periplasmic adaptor subunit [Elusimicrobiales bacterium]
MKNLINLLTVTALLGLSGCGEKTPGAAAEKPPAEATEATAALPDRVEVSAEAQKESGIKIEVVRRGSVPETFQAMGRVMQDAQKPHHIMAGGTGRLETVSAVLGQTVNPGEVLAVIKPTAGASVNATTPHKGIVTAVHASEGDQVNEMTFLFTLTEVDPLWGVLDIPERSLSSVKTGQKVDIKTAAYPGETFKGTVAFVSPEIDNVSRTVKARVAIENPSGQLKFGMFLDATVRTGAYFQGVAVPAGAVQNGPAGPFVFIKSGKTEFTPRPVEIGREKDGLLEVKNGVRAGESVVIINAYLLKSEMMKSQMGED